jgi:hypothetical protein
MFSNSSGLSGAPSTVERAVPYAEIDSFLFLMSFIIVAMISNAPYVVQPRPIWVVALELDRECVYAYFGGKPLEV